MQSHKIQRNLMQINGTYLDSIGCNLDGFALICRSRSSSAGPPLGLSALGWMTLDLLELHSTCIEIDCMQILNWLQLQWICSWRRSSCTPPAAPAPGPTLAAAATTREGSSSSSAQILGNILTCILGMYRKLSITCTLHKLLS